MAAYDDFFFRMEVIRSHFSFIINSRTCTITVYGSIASFYLETPFRISCRPVKQEEYYEEEYEQNGIFWNSPVL